MPTRTSLPPSIDILGRRDLRDAALMHDRDTVGLDLTNDHILAMKRISTIYTGSFRAQTRHVV